MLSPALAVFFVLALLFGLLWLARRKGMAALSLRLVVRPVRRSAKQMRVVERLPLTGQHSLHLVTCAGRLLGRRRVAAWLQHVGRFDRASAEAHSCAGGAR